MKLFMLYRGKGVKDIEVHSVLNLMKDFFISVLHSPYDLPYHHLDGLVSFRKVPCLAS